MIGCLMRQNLGGFILAIVYRKRIFGKIDSRKVIRFKKKMYCRNARTNELTNRIKSKILLNTRCELLGHSILNKKDFFNTWKYLPLLPHLNYLNDWLREEVDFAFARYC